MGHDNESRDSNTHSRNDEDGAQSERRVTTLMGDKVEPRRKWIEANVDFGTEDHNILENEFLHVEGDFE